MSEGFLSQPVVIVGAGRSGTNMLRDLLCEVPGVGTWPCDEINYIWRHGNVRYASDELPPSAARSEVKRYIRKQFFQMSVATRSEWLVEKTCANSLRVDFVDAVVPEAKFIFIVRNGVDVVASAMKRWDAGLDIGYVARKARYVPVGDLPYYASKYVANRLFKLVSGKQRLAFWGPRFDGFESYVSEHSLEEICAAQWCACVERADDAFARLDTDRVHRLRYEDFVADPGQQLDAILDFLGAGKPDRQIDTRSVMTDSVGRGAQQLGEDKAALITSMLAAPLARFGYHQA